MLKMMPRTVAICAVFFAVGCNAGSGTRRAGTAGVGGGAGPTAGQLLRAGSTLQPVSKGRDKTDHQADAPADIPICRLQGAGFSETHPDRACDGQATSALT